MASLYPTVAVEFELSGIGAGWTNLITDVLMADGLEISHGIRGGGIQHLVSSTATATFTMRNHAGNSGGLQGYYSLYHASKRTGWALGIGCRIRITDPNTAVVHTRFLGKIDAIEPTAGRYLEQRVFVTAVDWMDEAARWSLTPEVGEQIAQRDHDIVQAILAEMPIQPAATSFDVGADVYPYALDTGDGTRDRVLSAFAKLTASGRGLIYVKANGTLRVENRNTRLINTTVVWTIADSSLPSRSEALTLPSSREEIINTVRTTIHPRFVDPAPTTIVYRQASTILIPAGTTKFLLGAYRDLASGDPIGATAIQPLMAGTDYQAFSTDDGTGADLTADLLITVTAGSSGVRFEVENTGGSAAYLTLLQLLGKGVYNHGTTQLEATNAPSIATFGEHAVTVDMPYQDDLDVGQAVANMIRDKYVNPLAHVQTLTVLGKSTPILTQLLTRDISDRIAVTETLTGVNGEFFINGEDFRVLPSGVIEATYTLTTAYDPFNGDYWILGVSTLGNDTRLGL